MRNEVLIVVVCTLITGCTQLGIGSRRHNTWELTMENLPTGGCYLQVNVNKKDEHTDESVSIQNPVIGDN